MRVGPCLNVQTFSMKSHALPAAVENKTLLRQARLLLAPSSQRHLHTSLMPPGLARLSIHTGPQEHQAIASFTAKFGAQARDGTSVMLAVCFYNTSSKVVRDIWNVRT